MTRRDRCQATVVAQAQAGAAQIDVQADLLLLYAIDAELAWLLGKSDESRLAAGHLLVVKQPPQQQLHCAGAGFIATQIVNQAS